MGMDSYIMSTDAVLGSSVDFDTINVKSNEIWYWRKNWDVHAWMEKLYYKKGGKGVDGFNCECVELNYTEICQFVNEINGNKELKELLKIVAKEVSHGKKLYFFSWY